MPSAGARHCGLSVSPRETGRALAQVQSLAQRRARAAAAENTGNATALAAGGGLDKGRAAAATAAAPTSGVYQAPITPDGAAPAAGGDLANGRRVAAQAPAPGMLSTTITPNSTTRRTLAEVNANSPTYTGVHTLHGRHAWLEQSVVACMLLH